MATRSKHARRKWHRPVPEQAAPPEQTPDAQAQPPATPPSEPKTAEPTPADQAKPANAIRKGIYLSALIYVEGDVPAPDDFISPATNAVKSALEQALKGEHGGLSMTLKKVEVRNDVEQDDTQKEGKAQEEKFQF
ncbi:MAG: hypothetical protein QOH93_3593 [Chloroflexia bacterium]|nr:hypothetical protein [Chloroflexia bacterium]